MEKPLPPAYLPQYCARHRRPYLYACVDCHTSCDEQAAARERALSKARASDETYRNRIVVHSEMAATPTPTTSARPPEIAEMLVTKALEHSEDLARFSDDLFRQAGDDAGARVALAMLEVHRAAVAKLVAVDVRTMSEAFAEGWVDEARQILAQNQDRLLAAARARMAEASK